MQCRRHHRNNHIGSLYQAFALLIIINIYLDGRYPGKIISLALDQLQISIGYRKMPLVYCRLVSQVTDTGTAGFSGTKEQNVFQMTFFLSKIYKIKQPFGSAGAGSFCFLLSFKMEGGSCQKICWQTERRQCGSLMLLMPVNKDFKKYFARLAGIGF